MAYGIEGFDLGTVVAGADLSALQHTAVLVGSSGFVTAGAGAPADGFLQNDPASGEIANVRITGVSKAVAGAAVAQGAEVTVGTTGKIITATSGDNIIGRALEAASADLDIIPVLISKQGIKPV
jgi:hypothetical protein